MSSTTRFCLEVLLPTLALSIAVGLFHRSKARTVLFAHGPVRSLISFAGAMILVLVYWQLTAWAFFSIYGRVASDFGHQAIGSSWDIGLTYSLSLALILQLLVVAGHSIHAGSWKRRGVARPKHNPRT